MSTESDEAKRKIQAIVAALEHKIAVLSQQNSDLRHDLAAALAAVDFYGNEIHYDMDHFFTYAPLHEVGEKPTLVRREGNPIMYDHGDIARSVLARMKLVSRKEDGGKGTSLRPVEEERSDT